VTFTFLEDAPDNYSVSLTYFDVDEDTVTIASTDELVDAIEQFSGKKVLRISTEVKAKSESTKNPQTPTAAPSENVDRETSHGEPGLHPQVQTILESFVGILATAVTSLQEGLAAPEVTPGQNEASAATVSKKAPPSADNDEGEVTSKAAPPRDVKETLDRSSQTAKPPPVPVEETEEAAHQFIHGRHTCDSCLTTPIIGKRYNAQNLPDYDLCENCHKSYKGNEVKFEVAELGKLVEKC
jgi:hypothetical protein